MTAQSAILAGRAAAESLMLDQCVIRRETGREVDEWGASVPTYSEIYTGRCKIQTYEAQESRPEAGDLAYTVMRYTVHLPITMDPDDRVNVNDIIEITDALMEPSLVGRRYRIAATFHKSMATAQRVGVQDWNQDST